MTRRIPQPMSEEEIAEIATIICHKIEDIFKKQIAIYVPHSSLESTTEDGATVIATVLVGLVARIAPAFDIPLDMICYAVRNHWIHTKVISKDYPCDGWMPQVTDSRSKTAPYY